MKTDPLQGFRVTPGKKQHLSLLRELENIMDPNAVVVQLDPRKPDAATAEPLYDCYAERGITLICMSGDINQVVYKSVPPQSLTQKKTARFDFYVGEEKVGELVQSDTDPRIHGVFAGGRLRGIVVMDYSLFVCTAYNVYEIVVGGALHRYNAGEDILRQAAATLLLP